MKGIVFTSMVATLRIGCRSYGATDEQWTRIHSTLDVDMTSRVGAFTSEVTRSGSVLGTASVIRNFELHDPYHPYHPYII